jgi:hypothetical protein
VVEFILQHIHSDHPTWLSANQHLLSPTTWTLQTLLNLIHAIPRSPPPPAAIRKSISSHKPPETPLFVGEFGVESSSSFIDPARYIKNIMQAFIGREGAGWTQWVYSPSLWEATARDGWNLEDYSVGIEEGGERRRVEFREAFFGI